MQTIDFLAIGDVVTDAFIRLKDAKVHCAIDTNACELCVRFGDKVPFESVEVIAAVGNSANAAVAAARLGLSSYLLAHVGADEHGKECIETLQKNGVQTEYVYSHEGIPTNYHYVLWYDVERTILVKHSEFPYTLPELSHPPRFIYLSSLGENSLAYHKEIAAYVAAHPETKLIFQPGTFQIKLGVETLKEVYAQTYAFFCNVEEAQRITNTTTDDIVVLLKTVHDIGPRYVFITDGIKGAYGYDGEHIYFMPVYPQDPYERTGAGDAFASTVSCALALGKSLEEALMWGPINSMSVVQYVGAQKGLLTREKLETYLRTAPVEYHAKKIQ